MDLTPVEEIGLGAYDGGSGARRGGAWPAPRERGSAARVGLVGLGCSL